ncbi:MAG: NTP transferase domain-containing protein [Myxococcota bacterium]
MIAPRLAAVVLCGGASRRMGRDKAWIPFGGASLLQRVSGRLAAMPSVAAVFVVAAANQDLPPLPPGVEVRRDPERDGGPLLGLATGLRAAAATADQAFVTTTDAPFIHASFVRRLAVLATGTAATLVCDEDGERLHPLTAVYRCTLHVQAGRRFAEGERRALALAAGARPVRHVTRRQLLADPALRRDDPELLCLSNVNTPAELAAARRRLPLGSP